MLFGIQGDKRAKKSSMLCQGSVLAGYFKRDFEDEREMNDILVVCYATKL